MPYLLSSLFPFFGLNDRRSEAGDRRRTNKGKQSYRRKTNLEDKTVVSFSPHAFKNIVSTQDAEDQMDETPMLVQQQNYIIRLAHSRRSFKSTSLLVQRMYLKKGYDIPNIEQLPDNITLSACQNGVEAGTITLSIDTGNGIQADVNYKQEIDQLRAENIPEYELTKCAVDKMHGSTPILAALFHVTYIYGRILQKQATVVIEVTPKHAQFYKRMLEFEQIGSVRINSRVNTAGVLLGLKIEHIDRQIDLWGGKANQALKERSLSPYFFSREDGKGIAQHLLQNE